MTEFGNRLATLTIEVQSPDGRLTAVVRGRGFPSLSFIDPESIEDYNSAQALEQQMNRAIELAIDARSRGRELVVEQFSALEVRRGVDAEDTELRAFENECNEVVGIGVSASGVVEVVTVGLRVWEVDIDPYEFETVDSSHLCREVNSAVRSASSNFLGKVRALRIERFVE